MTKGTLEAKLEILTFFLNSKRVPQLGRQQNKNSPQFLLEKKYIRIQNREKITSNEL